MRSLEKPPTIVFYPQISLATSLRVLFLINYASKLSGAVEMGWLAVWSPYLGAIVLDVVGIVAFEVWRKIRENDP